MSGILCESIAIKQTWGKGRTRVVKYDPNNPNHHWAKAYADMYGAGQGCHSTDGFTYTYKAEQQADTSS